MIPPAPTPATAPPRDIVGLVGIATWLWVDPGIVWAVTWTATSGEAGALADMTTTTAFDLTIGEIQAVVCYDTPLGQCNPTTTLG